MKLKLPNYHHILRIDPKTSPEALKAFKDSIRCTNEQGLDLNGIAEEPKELVDRNWKDTQSTSTEARIESKRLFEKYGADNILDWQEDNWGVKCNVKSSTWIDKFSVLFEAQEDLSTAIITLAAKHKIDLYISHAEESEEYIENSCGLSEFKRGVREDLDLGDDNFQKYVFGTILLNQKPLSFKKWEKTKITQTNPKEYYFEHFIEEDARNRIKSAFENSKLTEIANTMVNIDEGTWEKLSLLF